MSLSTPRVDRGLGRGEGLPAPRGRGHREGDGERRTAGRVPGGPGGGLLKGAASFLFALVITLAVLFFLLRDAASFQGAARRVLPFGAEQNARLMAMASELVSASVTASIAIAALQGVIGGVTFALLGVDGAVLWGATMFLLSFLPLVGATLVWLPAAVWLALSGSLVKGIVLAAVGVLVLGNVDNVVRPLLLSGKAQMNTLVLIISLMGGVSAFGFIGIVLGPLVAALVTALVESYQAEPAVAAVEAAAPPAAEPSPPPRRRRPSAATSTRRPPGVPRTAGRSSARRVAGPQSSPSWPEGATHGAPSSSRSARFAGSPPPKPVSEPSLPMTRWQGTTMGSGFWPFAAPTAREAAGFPTRRASSA